MYLESLCYISLLLAPAFSKDAVDYVNPYVNLFCFDWTYAQYPPMIASSEMAVTLPTMLVE